MARFDLAIDSLVALQQELWQHLYTMQAPKALKRPANKGFTQSLEDDITSHKQPKAAMPSFSAGFTLIEVLIVIGILAILASIVIIAINPAKQFAQARNTQREAAISTILNAIGQRMADNKGIFAGEFTIGSDTYTCGPLPSGVTPVLTTEAGNTTNATGALGCLVPTYVAALPVDPSGASGSDTGFTVQVNTSGRVTLCAPKAADETSIPGATALCVTR